MTSSALDEARSKVASGGGTVGEQLVYEGQVTDDALTAFYKQRLLVPQVHPNVLARLPAKVVAVIPSDMAIELRAIPVSVDAENNLTVAMSDPSDRHAVDQISVFTGSYVVRAVATQMQIAWCLAHYYGHVTELGARLLQPTVTTNPDDVPTPRQPRVRGITGEVDAMRHKGLVPGEVAATQSSEAITERHVAPQADMGDDTVRDGVAAEAADAARSVSGEIRVHRRAPSIKPPLPDDSGPVIIMEADTPPHGVQIEDDTSPARRPAPTRRRVPAEPDPPELAARAGEVASVERESSPSVDAHAPSIVIDDSFEREAAPKPAPQRDASGEIVIRDADDADSAPSVIHNPEDAESAPVVIRDVPNPVEDAPSAPILLDRRRTDQQPPIKRPEAVVVKGPRVMSDRRTSVGVGLVGNKRIPRDTAVEDLPAMLEDEVTGEHGIGDGDTTRLELRAAPPGDDVSSDDHLAAPPSPHDDDDDSGPVAHPPSPYTTPSASGHIRLSGVIPRKVHVDDEFNDESEQRTGHPTMVMTALELDEVIPDRTSEIMPAHLAPDDVDDGWGPPGTTIPPPLLGAIPGTDEPASGMIPLPDLEHQPLIVSPPSPPEHGRPHTQTEAGVARMLEQATMRVLELIHTLERAQDRDDVVATMITHLAESHRRTGFFAVRSGEVSLFAILPRLAMMPAATLRLDRVSTLADVVATRLPYRGPMHDQASRTFLQSVLGACPAEILLVPITVRDRVVGILFGEHRLRHTFDDQLALAGRAAGNALERILKAKRG